MRQYYSLSLSEYNISTIAIAGIRKEMTNLLDYTLEIEEENEYLEMQSFILKTKMLFSKAFHLFHYYVAKNNITSEFKEDVNKLKSDFSANQLNGTFAAYSEKWKNDQITCLEKCSVVSDLIFCNAMNLQLIIGDISVDDEPTDSSLDEDELIGTAIVLDKNSFLYKLASHEMVRNATGVDMVGEYVFDEEQVKVIYLSPNVSFEESNYNLDVKIIDISYSDYQFPFNRAINATTIIAKAANMIPFNTLNYESAIKEIQIAYAKGDLNDFSAMFRLANLEKVSVHFSNMFIERLKAKAKFPITHLDVTGNLLTSSQLFALLKSIRPNQLEVLKFAYNNYLTINELHQIFNRYSNTKELSFGGFDCRNVDLGKLVNVTLLEMKSCKFVDLPVNIKSLPLKTISLEDNNLNRQSIETLLEIKQLESLDLSQNDLSESIDLEMFKKFTKLKSIKLVNVGLTDDNFVKLLRKVNEDIFGSLTEIDLSFNHGITDKGITEILLRVSKSFVKKIYFSGILIATGATKGIIEILQTVCSESPQLRFVSLIFNNLDQQDRNALLSLKQKYPWITLKISTTEELVVSDDSKFSLDKETFIETDFFAQAIHQASIRAADFSDSDIKKPSSFNHLAMSTATWLDVSNTGLKKKALKEFADAANLVKLIAKNNNLKAEDIANIGSFKIEIN